MASPRIFTILTLLLTSLPRAISHGDHNQEPIEPQDWALAHMISEHHISNFDAGSFFNLHDYSSSGQWSRSDIQRTYGLYDVSNNHVSSSEKESVADKILSIFDKDLSGTISYAEFTIGSAHGLKLPDLGHGPGHHGDDEYEYEIHHFEKYHDENTREEDLIHPEDIAHFKMHDEREAEEERVRNLDRRAVVSENIPAKFRRRG